MWSLGGLSEAVLPFGPFKATPHNCSCGALWKFCDINALQKLEIHKVFLHFCAFFCRKICSQIALAELCGVALSYLIL
jgi:hypothetical protein